MSFDFWAWSLLIPSSLLYLKIVDRRLKERSEPFHKIYNPFMLYRLDFQDYLLLFGVAIMNLGIMLFLYKFGLILPRNG
jgi:hypothetical protein